MNNHCINIAISGLGLLTIDDIKKRLLKYIPKTISVNWTTLADKNLDCLLVNEDFLENNHIQNLIHVKKLPFLKVTKSATSTVIRDLNTLNIPIIDDAPLNYLIQKCCKTEIEFSNNNEFFENQNTKSHLFFNKLYSEYCHKLALHDQNGIIAVIDHHAHIAWPCVSRHAKQTDGTLIYKDAITSDLIKISRKTQLNLENWLFELIYTSEPFLDLPEESSFFKLGFWPQPLHADKKRIFQLSSAFALGAQISNVSSILDIPVQDVQKFIVANQAINNIELISSRDAQFGMLQVAATKRQEKTIVKSFFQKLKRKFGF